MKNKLAVLLSLFFLLSAFKADRPVLTIFMIGDSTMANKNITGGNPERGWGMMLPGYIFVSHCRIAYHKKQTVIRIPVRLLMLTLAVL